MGVLVIASTDTIIYKIDTLKTILHHGKVSIIFLSKVNSNWSQVPLKENLFCRMGVWYKTRIINTSYKKRLAGDDPFQIAGTARITIKK